MISPLQDSNLVAGHGHGFRASPLFDRFFCLMPLRSCAYESIVCRCRARISSQFAAIKSYVVSEDEFAFF